MGRWIRESVLWLGAVVGLLSIVGGVAVIGFGCSFLVFRSGSMEPEIPTGSLALARTVDAAQIEPGDVVSVTTAAGTRVTHRVVEVQRTDDSATLTLKGDANKAVDEETYAVTSAPRVVDSVPGVGYVVAQLFSPPGLLIAGALGAGLLILGVRSDRDAPRGGRRRAAPHGSRGRATLVGAASAAVLVTGITVTDAAFTDPAEGETTGTAARYFTCTSALGASNLDPWAWFEFDETSNTTTTLTNSAGGVAAAFRAGAGRTATKACGRDTGKSGTFNGTSTYASTATVLNSNGASGNRWNTFTVSLWFRSTSQTTSGNLISMGGSQTGGSTSHDRHVILTTAGALTFGVYPGALREISTTGTDYADNQWHMVTATLSSAGMKLYVDGQLEASRTDTTTAEQMGTMFWRIGWDTMTDWGNGMTTSPFFAGRIDEVAIWTTALSDDDVYGLYRAAEPN